MANECYTYEEALDDVLKHIRTMLISKRHDYGENNLKKHGLYGILVRLDDKTARINNLLNKECIMVNDESIVNTFADIAGYAIQGILLEQNRL
jgi:hypothetical protein